MTAIATLPVLLGVGIHSARPAASAVGKGGLYSCTTHSLIYQTDGSSWTTWASLVGSGLTDPMTTRGDVIVRNASNVTARLGIGSSGKVLSSDGTDISWQTPSSGGALVLLEQHTASTSATLDFTTFISSTYDTYKFQLVDVLPATNAVVLYMRMGTGGGPTYDAGANYGFGMIRYNAAGAAGSGTNTGATQIEATSGVDTMSNDATYNGCSGDLTLTTPGSATYKKVRGQVGYKSTNWEATDFTGIYLSTTAVTAVRFLFSSGNIASGTIRVYGIAK